MKELLNREDIVQVDTDKSGWGFFSPELSFFLVDFCKKQLTPIQSIIFYAYFVNGMTLVDIAERIYGPEQQDKFTSDEECDEDDEMCEGKIHSSHQAIHHQIKKIEKKLRYSWKYMDRWSDAIVTKRVRGKKVRILNPNNKKEK